MSAPRLFFDVLQRAIEELEGSPIPVFTFALYHDHESRAVSVCVDTEENSLRVVKEINRYNAKHFFREIGEGSLSAAFLWQSNVGRSLSLGDFSRVNIARTALGEEVETADDFYLEMVRSVCSVAPRVARLAPDTDRLLFAASGANSEVEYVWSLADA